MLQHHYALPVCSGLLLALVFFPFYLWPLALVALAPLFYFAGDARRTAREVFFGGFITGFLGVGPLIYLSLAQLTLFPDAAAFTFFIRASSIPAVFLAGTLFGLMAVGYRFLGSGSVMKGGLVAAALYLLLVETPFFWIFGGYYYASLAHALAPLYSALFVASLGGAPLVSFLAAGSAAVLAGALWRYKQGLRMFWLGPAFIGVLLIGFSVLHQAQLFGNTEGGEVLAVSLIQSTPHRDLSLLEGEIMEAAQGAELVIYPFSPVVGATYAGPQPEMPGLVAETEDASLGAWLAGFVPSSTTVMLWNTTAEEGTLYDENAFWHDGRKTFYRKQILYPLSDDYTPSWLRRFGIERSPYALTAGPRGNTASLSERAVGNLICSELHQSALARETAARSPFIISAGSDSMFPGPLSGDFSLAATRLRAAENAVAVIRGNLLGPSAIVNADGSLQASLDYGQTGVIRGAVPLAVRSATPYAKTGSAPVFVLALTILGFATVTRAGWSPRFLRKREQY